MRRTKRTTILLDADLLDRLDYDGWVGCEYKPLTTTEAGLGWLPK